MIRTTVGALRLGVWSGLSEGPSQDKGYQDGDPDQGDTERPRRSLDRRQALQSSRRALVIPFLKTLPLSGAGLVRASGPWRVSTPGDLEVTALNNQRQTN